MKVKGFILLKNKHLDILKLKAAASQEFPQD